MNKLITFLILLLISQSSFSQKSLEKLLDQYNSHSVPYLQIEELHDNEGKYILLDAREEREYKVSRIKNAIHVGYDFFSLEIIKKQGIEKKQNIVVYCSLGIRSEDVAEALKKAGYQNVFNLYGGIFEWKNEGHAVKDSNGKDTDNVHVYSREWAKWLNKGNKVYD